MKHETNSGIKAGDVMTRKFIYVKPDTSIINTLKIMSKKRIGSVLVVENKKLKGILTERDIIDGLVKKKRIIEKKVKDVMTKTPITISPSKDIMEAMNLINKKGIRRLPVTVENTIVGLLTIKDILKIQPSLIDLSMQKVRISEEEEKWKGIRALDDDRWVKEGPCDECGAYDILYRIGNKHFCGICKDNIEEDSA